MTILDFAREYAGSGVSRFHMPGHKGVRLHGMESVDLTEIKGADSLYEAEGIIAEGERLTSGLYGSAATCWWLPLLQPWLMARASMTLPTALCRVLTTC